MRKLTNFFLSQKENHALLTPFKFYINDFDIQYCFGYVYEMKKSAYYIYVFFADDSVHVHTVHYIHYNQKCSMIKDYSNSYCFTLRGLNCTPFITIKNYFIKEENNKFIHHKIFEEILDNYKEDFIYEYMKFFGI